MKGVCDTPLLAVAVVLGTVGAGWCASDSDSVAVTLTIEQHVDVLVPDPVNVWGQGLLDNGEPNYAKGDGADPQFAGGSAGHTWPGDGEHLYCRGAVGRSPVLVSGNGMVRLRIKPEPASEYPQLSDGAGHVLPGHATLAWDDGSGQILPWPYRDLSLDGTDSSTWLYVMVKRRALGDRAGTYTATIYLEAWTL